MKYFATIIYDKVAMMKCEIQDGFIIYWTGISQKTQTDFARLPSISRLELHTTNKSTLHLKISSSNGKRLIKDQRVKIFEERQTSTFQAWQLVQR